MRFRDFYEYLQWREGLVLPDKPVTPGGSRINPFPATQPQLERMASKPARPRKPSNPFKLTPPATFKPKPAKAGATGNQ